MRNLNPTEVKRLQREWRRRTERPLALLLDNVQTPYNVGAILRTAAAYKLDHVWFAGSSATPDHPGSRKTSLGTERLVPWSVVATVTEGAAQARAQGLEVIGLELAVGAQALGDAVLGGGACLVIGHEDRGLSSAGLGVCDRFVYVATPGKVGSLNVATATAIALYELRRQEWSTAAPSADDRSDAKGIDLDP